MVNTRAVVASVVALALAGSLLGCAPTRSVEAYCAVLAEHKAASLEATSQLDGGSDLIGGLVTLVAALGDVSRMCQEAAEVAPEEIRADVEAVAETWNAQFEAAEDAASKSARRALLRAAQQPEERRRDTAGRGLHEPELPRERRHVRGGAGGICVVGRVIRRHDVLCAARILGGSGGAHPRRILGAVRPVPA